MSGSSRHYFRTDSVPMERQVRVPMRGYRKQSIIARNISIISYLLAARMVPFLPVSTSVESWAIALNTSFAWGQTQVGLQTPQPIQQLERGVGHLQLRLLPPHICCTSTPSQSTPLLQLTSHLSPEWILECKNTQLLALPDVSGCHHRFVGTAESKWGDSSYDDMID